MSALIISSVVSMEHREILLMDVEDLNEKIKKTRNSSQRQSPWSATDLNEQPRKYRITYREIACAKFSRCCIAIYYSVLLLLKYSHVLRTYEKPKKL